MFSEMVLELDSKLDETNSSHRQHRTQVACTMCKRRKIRCDSAEMPGNRCSHCTSLGLDCVHADLTKASISAKGYVSALESRVEKLEKLLNKLLPGIDLTKHLENDDNVRPLLHHQPETLPRNDDDNLSLTLGKLKANPEKNRFFGKSSGIQLVQTALNFESNFSGVPHSYPILPNKRERFWGPIPWLFPPADANPQYTFPDPDLLTSLVDLYFKEVNCFSPVLHRPTFERKLAVNLHIRDHRFAATLLMVCSLGARYSDDPRVLLEGDTTRHSAGHKWHDQVSVIPQHLVYKPDLYELQTIALSAMYLMVISPKVICWNLIGFGLRRAQDVGAHRRNPCPQSIAQNEQWKRVFWVLLCLEWNLGTLTGRPLAMHDQDYDQNLPLDCDDECWDVPLPNFTQPKNKPSQISYFIHYIKILEIQAAVATTIYSARKPKDFHGRKSPPTDTLNHIMAFDSALNSWLLGVPNHLRWDPNRTNRLHRKQSAFLYATYYNVQILVHRPYIPLEASLPGSHPSLAICTNAARSCVRIFDAQNKAGVQLHPSAMSILFTSGIVLLLYAWTGKRSSQNTAKEFDLVRECMDLAAAVEDRYMSAGRFKDGLSRMLQAGDNLDSLFESISSESTAAARNVCQLDIQQKGLDCGPASFEWANTIPYLDAAYNLEQLVNTDIQQPSADTMDVDTDMSIWLSNPSNFLVENWFDGIPNPQFDQVSGELYL